MRTTLTVDPDIARRLKEIARLERKSFKTVVNETLRAGLDRQRGHDHVLQPFKVDPEHCGFLPGVDTAKLNQYMDQLESDDFAAESRPHQGYSPAGDGQP